MTPGHVNYRGYDVYELPPNGQGYAALQMLAILEHVEVAELERGGPELLHYIVEAKRLRNDREVEVTGIEEGARVLLRPPSASENETKL